MLIENVTEAEQLLALLPGGNESMVLATGRVESQARIRAIGGAVVTLRPLEPGAAAEIFTLLSGFCEIRRRAPEPERGRSGGRNRRSHWRSQRVNSQYPALFPRDDRDSGIIEQAVHPGAELRAADVQVRTTPKTVRGAKYPT
ncbi:hypothetical protein [Amycolatopsis sp. NPDC051903]|uniref:hypothetical protein n=1 Tax=Amycolatopsis sp. NPDC051903 TaxID=3363936 RepID=UPI0037BBE4D2